jgi:hypothetical protein
MRGLGVRVSPTLRHIPPCNGSHGERTRNMTLNDEIVNRVNAAARAAGIELGDVPTVAEVVRIADALGVDAADLILG